MGSNDPTDREDVALSTSELDDVLSSAEIRSESGNDEESGLEKYGIWIKVEPETLEAEAGGDFQVADLDSGAAAGAQLTAEEEQLLGELETEAEQSPGASPATGETADFEGLEKDLQELDSSVGEEQEEDVVDLDLELEEMTEERGKMSEIEVPLSDGIPALDSLEETAAAEASAAGPHSSEAILKKIEQDLKQIKLEIQNLKKELAGRGGEAATSHAGAAPGFFPEEEDDSIALTGDELDNILNTADITEQQAGGPMPEEDLQEVALPEAEEVLQESAVPEAEELLQESADLELLEPGSLDAEPEQVQIELEEEPAAEDLDLDLGSLEEPPASPTLELEELEEDGATELVLEEPAESPALQAVELDAEEPALAEDAAEDVLSLDELPAEPAAEPEEMEALDEAEAAPEGSLELMEELPDLSLSDEQGASGPEEEPAEPVELELMEEIGAEEPVAELPAESPGSRPAGQSAELPEDLREDVKSVLSYLDQLLEALPDEKIRQFAQSEYFGVYKRLFEELGLGA